MYSRNRIDELTRTMNAPLWKFWVRKREKLRASGALALCGEAAIPALVDSLSRPGWAYAATALRQIGPAAGPALARCLRGRAATVASATLNADMAESCMEEIIEEFHYEGAEHAVCILAAIGPAALGPLRRALEHPQARVRLYAALTLGQMGRWAQEALPALRNALTDPDGLVRAAAESAMEKVQG